MLLNKWAAIRLLQGEKVTDVELGSHKVVIKFTSLLELRVSYSEEEYYSEVTQTSSTFGYEITRAGKTVYEADNWA